MTRRGDAGDGARGGCLPAETPPGGVGHGRLSVPGRHEARISCPLLEGDLEPWIRCCTRRFLPLARRVAGKDEHARDALHASWVRVLDKLQQYHGSPPACGWVAAIVRHEALHDAVARSRVVPLPDEDLPAADLPPDAAVYAGELRRLLVEAIDELPPMFQEVVRLRDIEDRPNAEVARKLHISKRNVATRLHRAHRLLRRRLRAHR